MDILVWNTFKLRQPLLDVLAVRVIVELLGPRIEDPEIGLGVSTIANCPLPPPTILHCTEIDELAGEVSLSFVPVEEEILGEEGSSDHTASVVHEPSGIELPHSCINDWETSFAFLPGIQMGLIILPLDLVELDLEGVVLAVEHSREVMANVDVEIAPVQLVYEIVFHSQL